MRLADALDLPAVLSTAKLAQVTDTCERTWWAVARGEEQSPIDGLIPIRRGRRGVLRWPTIPVLRHLGLLSLIAGALASRDTAPEQRLDLVRSESQNGAARSGPGQDPGTANLRDPTSHASMTERNRRDRNPR